MNEMRRSGSSPELAPKIQLLLVYSSQLLGSALTSLLVQDSQIVLVGADADAQSAAVRLQHTHADVVLCGVRNAENVAHMISPIRTIRPESRVLVLGPISSERMQIACIEAGAAGFVCEDVDPPGLLQAIKRVHDGEILYAQTVLVGLAHRSGRRSRVSMEGFDAHALAPREIEVLQALVLGLSTEEVSDRLGITVSTVRTHLKKALEKLGAHSKLEAVIIALRMHIVTLPEREDDYFR